MYSVAICICFVEKYQCKYFAHWWIGCFCCWIVILCILCISVFYGICKYFLPPWRLSFTFLILCLLQCNVTLVYVLSLTKIQFGTGAMAIILSSIIVRAWVQIPKTQQDTIVHICNLSILLQWEGKWRQENSWMLRGSKPGVHAQQWTRSPVSNRWWWELTLSLTSNVCMHAEAHSLMKTYLIHTNTHILYAHQKYLIQLVFMGYLAILNSTNYAYKMFETTLNMYRFWFLSPIPKHLHA